MAVEGLIYWGSINAATDQTMATIVRTSGTETRQAIIDLIGPIAADILANDPAIQQAIADLIIGYQGLVTSSAVTGAEYEIAVGDQAGNPSWLRSSATGEPTEYAKKSMRRAVALHTGPLPAEYAQPGERYTWFVTDPATGELIDIRNGVG